MTRGPGRPGGSDGRDSRPDWPPSRGWPLAGRGQAIPAPARPPSTLSGFAASGGSLFDVTVPGASPASAVSVSTLAESTKRLIESTIRPLWVRGEVTDFKSHRSGHWYFSLRADGAQIRCVVWSGDQRGVPVAPVDGTAVVAYGWLTMYTPRGDVQFRITAMDATGDGLRRQTVERTLATLKRDGLLALERKRPLPRFPRCLAVITSPDGAALHDIVAVAHRRSPSLRIVLVAARVQGDGAPEALCAALDQLCRWRGADVVIVGRGGGAKDDLHAFNDERVARAVAACTVPTVSAVGHEIDVTLCDLVADHRAATPSAAAEAAVPVLADQEQRLRALAGSLTAASRRRLETGSLRLARATSNMRTSASRTGERRHARLESAAGRLQALSPLATLARGFAVARGEHGQALTTATDFAPGMPFDLVIRDGLIGAVTSRVEHATPEPRP